MKIFSSYKRHKPLEKKLGASIKKALIFLKKKGSFKNWPVDLEVYLISDLEIKKINRHFRKKDKTTNVLSFPFSGSFMVPGSRKTRFLGEVFLAPDYIRRRGEDLEYLALHGLLHLLGYTHKVRRDRIRMENMERMILRGFPRG